MTFTKEVKKVIGNIYQKLGIHTLPLFVAIVFAPSLFLMKDIYTASTRVLPPQSSGGASSLLMSQFSSSSALGSMAGGALGLKNPGELYVGLIKSRSIVDSLIRKFDLYNRYKCKTMVEARAKVSRLSSVSLGKDGIITIEFDDRDPKVAAQVANAYVDELGIMLLRLNVTEAGQKRAFFEKQLEKTRDLLAKSEIDLLSVQEKTGLIDPSAQGKVALEVRKSLESAIKAKEVQRAAMLNYSTENNPSVSVVNREIDELRSQIQKEKAGLAENGTPVSKLPNTSLEYYRKARLVKYYEALFEIMAKQYEAAKVEESKTSGSVQVIDSATPPDRKSKPKRSIILLSLIVVSYVLSFGLKGLKTSRQIA